ncbi:MAG: DUF3450 domain-containing protein [Thermodesulfobacteriota bacterium]|nr:DUF3450 domain-containing protein [Thermodesulfobacteriota bacterium]
MTTMHQRLTRGGFRAGGLAVVMLAVVSGLLLPVYAQERIDRPVKEAIDIRQNTQQQQEAWRQEKAEQLARLEKLEAEQKALKQRKRGLENEVKATKLRLAEKKDQLADIRQISEQIRPFLDELLDRLKGRVRADLPFLPDERAKRIRKMEELVEDPDAPVSEKYRRLIEALLVEAEYGFTTEVYQDTIAIEAGERLVNIFRLGRLNLFYLTLDRAQCGFYNVAEKQWQPLSGVHLPEIKAAVDIAAKRRTAELLTLPLGRIVSP